MAVVKKVLTKTLDTAKCTIGLHLYKIDGQNFQRVKRNLFKLRNRKICERCGKVKHENIGVS